MDKWLDVGTTAIPRLTLERCLGSFLDFIDPCGYKLRWIFHLDQYPEPGLERYWQDTLNQALRLAPRFDSAVIMASTTNQSWGVSVRRIMREVEHDLLWIEDDYVWLRPWRVDDMLAYARDGYNFQRKKVKFGATSPTFWRKHTVDYLLEHFPRHPEKASENEVKRILSHRRRRGAGFMMQAEYGPIGNVFKHPVCEHIGREELLKHGFTHNFWGVPLDEPAPA